MLLLFQWCNINCFQGEKNDLRHVLETLSNHYSKVQELYYN